MHGTVNDLAVCGAEPLYLSLGLIVEEGLPLETLQADRRQRPRRGAGVRGAGGDGRHQGGAPRRRGRALRQHDGRRPAASRRRPRRRTASGRAIACSSAARSATTAWPSCRRARGSTSSRTSGATPRRCTTSCGPCSTMRRRRPLPARPDPRRRLGRAARGRGGGGRVRRPRRVGACRWPTRSAGPASSSASTRCTWPTRGSCWPSSPRRRPRALLAQSVEHLHGKEGVDGSSPSEGFAKQPAKRQFRAKRSRRHEGASAFLERFWNGQLARPGVRRSASFLPLPPQTAPTNRTGARSAHPVARRSATSLYG